MDRRTFLKSAAATGLTMSAGTTLVAAPSKTYRAGLIGCGWYGMVDLRHLMSTGQVEVVALCDVDKKHLADAAVEVGQAQKNNRPQTFADFREMLKPKNLDIVLVGTPDHWHALASIAALEAGADVYVEKPICHTFLEGRAMVNTARKHSRVVQVGTQRRSTPHIAQAREFFKSGALGSIGVVRAYCYYGTNLTANPPDANPPESLDFDMWTGPAPLRPFNSMMHPKGWRNFSEYSNGILGDMGIHMLDTFRWIAGAKYPKSISGTGGIFLAKKSKANVSDTQTVTYDYGDFTAIWEHRRYGRFEDGKAGWGVNFYGEKGTLQVTLDYAEFQPRDAKAKTVRFEAVREANADVAKFEGTHIFPAGRAHLKNFVECVGSRARPVADIEEGHNSTAICLLGNVSMQLGRSLKWDAEKEQVVGDEEANKLLRREYRKPWVYPAV